MTNYRTRCILAAVHVNVSGCMLTVRPGVQVFVPAQTSLPLLSQFVLVFRSVLDEYRTSRAGADTYPRGR